MGPEVAAWPRAGAACSVSLDSYPGACRRRFAKAQNVCCTGIGQGCTQTDKRLLLLENLAVPLACRPLAL